MNLHIQHQTTYRYSRPVALDPHTLRQHPRQDGSLRILRFSRTLHPCPSGTTDYTDVEGNTCTQVWFDDLTTSLDVSVDILVETLRSNPFDYMITDPDQLTLPVRYPEALLPSVAAYNHAAEAAAQVRDFADAVDRAAGGQTLPFLSLLTSTLYDEIEPMVRLTGQAWSPSETLQRGTGTCRDVAVLFMEACRLKGLAARFVSGYWGGNDVDGNQHLHAWAEVLLPQAGWRGYDPSSGLAVADRHVPLAAGSVPAAAALISGAFWGANVHTEMTSRLAVREQDPAEAGDVA